MSQVGFDRSRLRKYYGNIGEIIAQEVLLKKGFELWLFESPRLPFKFRGKPVRGGLLLCLGFISGQGTRERIHYQNSMKELRSFFGGKLDAFQQYVAKLQILNRYKRRYTPDFMAKKNGKIYVVEVKANKGTGFLKKERYKGLILAKDYGFVPMLLTLNVKIGASDLVMTEL